MARVRSKSRVTRVGLVVATFAAIVATTSAALAAIEVATNGTIHWVILSAPDPSSPNSPSSPGSDDAPERFAGARGVDSADPWVSPSDAPTNAASSEPDRAFFHRWRPLDEADPWTAQPLARTTPLL